MGVRHKYEFVKQEFEKEGYTLLSKIYTGANGLLEIKCPVGHIFNLSWQKWSQGRRCKYCNRSRTYFVDIKQAFVDEGYVLLTTKDEYKNDKQKLKYICPVGHKHSVSWRNWLNGCRCKLCYIKNMSVSFLYVKSEIEKSTGYEVISDEVGFKNSRSKILCKCKEGHEFYTTWQMWCSGSRCKVCSLKKRDDKYRLDYTTIKKAFDDEDYVLLTKKYINAFVKLDYVCPNGHIGSIRWNDFQQGYRCGKCSHKVSVQEKEISDFINNLGLCTISSDRKVLCPHELDIIIPSKSIAIEYCGLYWHSESLGKDRKYHLNKLDRCIDRNMRLITIFEDEWLFKKEIVLSRLENILNISNDATKIYARKCIIKEIPVKEAKQFCNKNHLQGYNGSSIKLGAFYENKLVSVMTFSKPSIAKGSRDTTGLVWELHRFCSKINYRVIGIASKLLKHFERNYEWSNIFSYADRRWSDGNVYNQLGFNFVGLTQPNYWYIVNNKRIHRFAYRKRFNEPKNKTEWEIRKSQGLNRIWDCGNLKYEKRKEGKNNVKKD